MLINLGLKSLHFTKKDFCVFNSGFNPQNSSEDKLNYRVLYEFVFCYTHIPFSSGSKST